MSAVSIPTPTTCASRRTIAFGPLAPACSSRSPRAASICWICSVTTCRRPCRGATQPGCSAAGPCPPACAGRPNAPGPSQGRLEAPHSQARQGRFDPVHDPGALSHQAFALAGGAPGILFLQGRNGSHVTMLRLAPQPAQEHALEQGGVEPVGLGAPMLARDGDAGRGNDMRFNAVRSKPARQAEAVAAGLEGDGNARDRAAGLAGLLTPAVEELEGVLVGSELLERM